MAGKQEKIRSEYHQEKMLQCLEQTRYTTRKKLIFLLSVKAGLRIMETAYLKWRNILSSGGIISGQIIVEDAGSKGKRGGRTIPMHPLIRAELDSYVELIGYIRPNDRVIVSEHKSNGVSQGYVTTMLWLWYRDVGFVGASSHSGRRTFITNAARKISDCGGSIRDVQNLAGHKSLNTTQRYIDGNEEAKRRLIQML